MDRADRLIDQDEAERNSFVQHHVVTGRGSLFPVQGDASRSKFDEVAINDVMVSYIVDNDVEGLETTRIIKYADLSPHHSTMSHEDLAELLKKPQLSRSGELSYMLATPRVDRHARLVLPSGVETSAVLNDDCVPHSPPRFTLPRNRVSALKVAPLTEASPLDVEALASIALDICSQPPFLGQDSSARLLRDAGNNVLVPAKPHVFVLLSCVEISVSGELLVIPKRILLLFNSVKAATKLGLRALIGKAAVICTAASVATTPSFNIIHQSHATFLEEAGHARDVEIAGFFSHFWNACLRMFIGSVNPLGPAAFGQNNENPFAMQLTLSILPGWAAAGLEMNELNQTSRFKNPALLELCALANDMPQLQAVAGSFDDTTSAEYATINKAVCGIDSNLMFLTGQDATLTKDVSGSSYSLETTAAVMKDAADHTNTWRAIPIPVSVRRANQDYYMVSSAAY